MTLPAIEGEELEGSSRITLFNGECRIIAANLKLKNVMYSYKKIYVEIQLFYTKL
jgi:hypothetical protein